MQWPVRGCPCHGTLRCEQPPTLDALLDEGRQVGPAAYREGSKGDPVTLRPGETAHAPVGFVQVGNYDPDECEPTDVRGLRVYPPQETRSMYLENPGTGCDSDAIPSSLTQLRSHS
jgi:hypothetical protein